MGRIVTVQEVRDYTGHREDKDTLVERMIAGLERTTERYARRRFSPTPELVGDPLADTAPPITKTFAMRGQRSIEVPDLRTITSINYGGAALATLDEDYSVMRHPDEDSPIRFIELGRYTIPSTLTTAPGAANLEVTGRWGWLEPPEDIKHFVCSIVARSYKKREVNFADLVQQGPEGAIFRYIKSLPEELRMIIESYRPHRMALV